MSLHNIAQVLTNLSGNAYRYTLPGGRIALSCRWLGEGVLRVNVTGTGIRIAPEDQDGVFGRFYRADHPLVQQRSNGLGQGLALAKMFVEMHGSRIWVDSELGQAREHFQFHSADAGCG